jgi:hypothetical protein
MGLARLKEAGRTRAPKVAEIARRLWLLTHYSELGEERELAAAETLYRWVTSPKFDVVR